MRKRDKQMHQKQNRTSDDRMNRYNENDFYDEKDFCGGNDSYDGNDFYGVNDSYDGNDFYDGNDSDDVDFSSDIHANLDSSYDPDEPANHFDDPYLNEGRYDREDSYASGYGDSYNEPYKNEGYGRVYDDNPAKSVRKIKNRQIMSILYGFLVLFFGMIGYFVYFDVIKSDEATSNPNNVRIAKQQDTVIRGEILSSDGTVLAQTLTDDSGNEYRNYPYSNVFAHVVGASSTNKAGLESTEEYYLLQSSINPLQKAVNELKGEKSEGDNVVTTLDAALQQTAYDALGSNDGVVIAMEPTTGKILAMVSKPDYNPNTLAEDYESILADSDSKVLLNQATQGLFTPGSIFKMVTALEYLREYPNASSYSYTCYGSISLKSNGGTSSLSCYSGHAHGTQDLRSSFANSCNSSFANIGINLNVSKFSQLCSDMYFNTSLPTDIPHAKSTFSLGSDASEWEIGATAIGQGSTAMTPLHALILTSAVANGGVVMEPYLVDSVVSSAGTQVEKFTATNSGSIMTTDEASQIKEMMEAVVSEGTATSLGGLGYQIAGKTGTAEVEGSGNNAWFVGFAPADNPQIAVCVLIENSDTSSSYTAVPVAAQLFSSYLN